MTRDVTPLCMGCMRRHFRLPSPDRVAARQKLAEIVVKRSQTDVEWRSYVTHQYIFALFDHLTLNGRMVNLNAPQPHPAPAIPEWDAHFREDVDRLVLTILVEAS